MKIKIKTVTLTALALIGAGKVCSWIVHGTAWCTGDTGIPPARPLQPR